MWEGSVKLGRGDEITSRRMKGERHTQSRGPEVNQKGERKERRRLVWGIPEKRIQLVAETDRKSGVK